MSSGPITGWVHQTAGVAQPWYGLQDANRYVYHYTSSQTFADYILATGRLKFSRFGSVNDPYESEIFSIGFTTTTGEFGDCQRQIEAVLRRQLKDQWRVGCFVSDVDGSVDVPDGPGSQALQAIFERGHSRPRMWAQYADNHTGACLVFLRDALDQAISASAKGAGFQVSSGRVRYEYANALPRLDQPSAFIIPLDEVTRIGAPAVVEAHIDRFFMDLFLTKSKDWQMEREFRWLLHGGDDGDFFVDISSSLVGILLGSGFPSERKFVVGKYALENKIHVATLLWKNGLPQPKAEHAQLLMATGE